MKDLLKSKLTLSALIISGFWLVWYFALGGAIFKNMWNTSPAIPITGGLCALLPLCAVLLNYFVFKRKYIYVVAICLCVALVFAHFVLFAFVLSKLTYFFIAGTPYFITAGLFALIAFFVFAYPRLGKMLKRASASALALIIAIICLVCLFDATPFYISGGATVFAVDNKYQIAFATSHKSRGEIEIDGTIYYDETNGQNNIRSLHKISVPKEALDSAKSYTVRTQSTALNTAYLPSKGATISKTYSFRPVDESDGLQIYNLSDTHECIAGPANAGSYFGDKLDLLILNGDIINDVSSEYQISLIYKLAYKITGGSRPVLFTRGNHECNGTYANILGEFVGCAHRGFYFTLSYAGVNLLVIDTANDMADDNALINPIANFDEVRKRESAWLESLNKPSSGINIVIAHMAYPLSGYQAESCSWHEWARELVDFTNGNTDLAICGHSHKTDYIQPDTWDNAVADYPVLRGSLRSNKYADREGISPLEFTGTAIEIIGSKINMKFTNAKKQVLQEYVLEV